MKSVIKTKNYGELTVELLTVDIEHLPQHGLFRFDESLTVKIGPIGKFHNLHYIIEALFKELSNNPSLDDIERIINIADNYVSPTVSINERSDPLMSWAYVIHPYPPLDISPLLSKDRTREENAQHIVMAIREYQIVKAINEFHP